MTIGMLLDPYGEKSPGGLGRSIFEIARALMNIDHSNMYTVYVKNEPAHAPALPGGQWRLVVLGARFLWLTGAWRMDHAHDVYLFFTPVIPLFFTPKKSVVVALDFAYLSYADSLREKLSAWFVYRIHRRSLRLASRIIAISEETKREVVRLFGIDPSLIDVVHLSYIDLGSCPEPIPLPEHFFVFAGVLKARKNVAGIIRAFAQFVSTDTDGYKLVIVGKATGEYYESLVTLVRELGIQEKVVFVGYISNEQLSYVYAKARALVFPSFIEGFGMPLLEAMHLGLPVITSNTGALAEVAGDAALLVDPHDPGDIARGMRESASDSALHAALVQRGKERSQEFSWGKTARQFLEVITKVSNTNHL